MYMGSSCVARWNGVQRAQVRHEGDRVSITVPLGGKGWCHTQAQQLCSLCPLLRRYGYQGEPRAMLLSNVLAEGRPSVQL